MNSEKYIGPDVHQATIVVAVTDSMDTRRAPARVGQTKSDRGMGCPSAPRYLLHDRDGSYGEKFHEAAAWMGIREVLTAPQLNWQNAYVERLIGSIRRQPGSRNRPA
jgi:hypothetical protein